MKSTYQNIDWDSLSAAAKAEIAKVAIQKGVYSLDGIKNMYKEFAMGGDTSNTIYKSDTTINKDNTIKEWAANKDIHINNDGTITTRNGNTGEVILPDVNIYAQKNYNSAFDYNGANEVMGTIADFTPVVGDVKQGLEAINDLRKGDYAQAALGAGLLLLPNILEKPLKYASKSVKRLLGDAKFRFSKPEVNIQEITDEQWDKLYDKAIQSKDIAEAQRLRDLHFMTKSNTVVNKNGTPIKTYHTISDSYPTNFTEFNPDIEGTHSAIYTSNNPIMSGTYSRKLINKEEKDYYINSAYNNLKYVVENPDSYSKELVYKAKGLLASKSKFKKYIFKKIPQLDAPLHPNRQKELYVKLNNPITIDNHGNNWNFVTREGIPKEVNEKVYNRSVVDTGQLTTRDIERGLAQFDNYDGAIFNNITDYGPSWKSVNTDKQVGSVYQIKSPNNIKLSNAITYDDAGNMIPLSKRDNFKSKDIRYMLPWGIVGSSLGLANYTSKNKD